MSEIYPHSILTMLSFATWLLWLFVPQVSSATASESWLNCTRPKGFNAVDASLLTLSGGISSDGIVQVAIPSSSTHHSVCFPVPSMVSYRQYSYFSHVLCRQLGYMTYYNWYDQEIRKAESWDLQLDDFRCHGYEQSLAQCEWGNVTLSMCDRATAIHCHSCYNTIEDTEGVISSPGYPYGYFYTVLCEWNIVAPKGYQISLSFRKFHLPLGRYSTCEDETPYLEIASPEGKAWRFCAVKDVESLKLIDQREIKIRFYSGVYYDTPLEKRRDYGFNIVFKAEKIQQSSQTMKAVIISSGFVVFFVVVGLCYCVRKCYARNYRRRIQGDSPEIFDEIGPPSSQRKAQEMFLHPPSSNKENHPQQAREKSKRKGSRIIEAVMHSAGLPRYVEDITPCAGPGSNLAGTYKMERGKRFSRSKLRTILLSKFTPRSEATSSRGSATTPKRVTKMSQTSPIPQVPGFKIYHSLSSASELEDNCCVGQDGYAKSKTGYVNRSFNDNELVSTGIGCGSPSFDDDSDLSPSRSKKGLNSSCNLPKIVVECVDEKSRTKT